MSYAHVVFADSRSIESAPLLSLNEDYIEEPAEENSQEQPTRTPLPWTQLAVIYTIKLMLPISQQQVLPYINMMIRDIVRSSEKSVGYYSGFVSTGTTAGAFLSVYFWGRLSDSVGRTPILTVGMIFLAMFTISFGLSTTFLMLFICRFLGFTGVIHSVVGELSDSTNQSVAFPFYDVMNAVGFIIGPMIGGFLVAPAEGYPAWFGGEFWKRFPYFLPCLVTSILGFGAALLAASSLRETHPLKAQSNHSTVTIGEAAGPAGQIVGSESTAPPSLQSLLALPDIRAICASQFMLGFLGTSFNLVFVLISFTQIENGGLSLHPYKISATMSILGLIAIVLKLSLPIFLRRYDTLKVFRFTMRTWPITFGLMPLLNVIARRVTVGGTYHSFKAEVGLWLAISFVLFMSRLGCLAFSIVMIVTKDHTPTPLQLATTNSVSEFSQMIGSAVGAPIVSSLFAYSISGHILSGYLWVIVMCTLSLLGDISVSRIRKHRS